MDSQTPHGKNSVKNMEEDFSQENKPKPLNSTLIMQLNYYSFHLKDQFSDFDVDCSFYIGFI